MRLQDVPINHPTATQGIQAPGKLFYDDEISAQHASHNWDIVLVRHKATWSTDNIVCPYVRPYFMTVSSLRALIALQSTCYNCKFFVWFWKQKRMILRARAIDRTRPQNPRKCCFSSAGRPRMNFVISMGLPNFFLDSWNCLRKNNYMNDQF